MPSCKGKQVSGYRRTVGDPIDVVTGANIDWNRDFLLGGPLPFDWIRHYDSSKAHCLCALGWGHTHRYDCHLKFDADGMRYVAPIGKEIGFPPLLNDGAEFAHEGVVIRRVDIQTYQILEHGSPVREFVFRHDQPTAPLNRLIRGKHAIVFAHDREGRLERIMDSLGRTIQVGRDQEGRVLGLVLMKPKPKPDRPLVSCHYDRTGNLIECVDPYRHAFSFRYDRHHRLIASTDRRGYTFLFEYDEQGRCTRSSGEDGLLAVRLKYSPIERITEVTRADGGRWTYFFNEGGTVTRVIDPYGGACSFVLDDNGRVKEELDPNGNVSRHLYNSAGAPVGKIDSLGRFHSPAEAGDQAPGQDDVPDTGIEWEQGSDLAVQDIRLPSEFGVRGLESISEQLRLL